MQATFDQVVSNGDIVLVPEVGYKLLDGPEVWQRGGDVVDVKSDDAKHRGIFSHEKLEEAIDAAREKIVSSFKEAHGESEFTATNYLELKKQVEQFNEKASEKLYLPDIKAIRLESIVNPTGEMWAQEQIRDVARTLLEENKKTDSNIMLIVDDVYNDSKQQRKMHQGAAVLAEPEFAQLSSLYLSGLHKRLSPQAKSAFAYTNNPELHQYLSDKHGEIELHSLKFAQLGTSQEAEHIKQRYDASEKVAKKTLIQGDAMFLLYNGVEHPDSKSMSDTRVENAINAIAKELETQGGGRVSSEQAKEKAAELTSGHGIPGVEVIARDRENNRGYFLEAVYDDAVIGKTIHSPKGDKVIQDSGDLSIANSTATYWCCYIKRCLNGVWG